MFVEDNCPMAKYLLCIEEPFPSSLVFLISSLLFIAMVGLDKQIVFRKVIGMERMLCQVQQFQPAPINHQEYMITMSKFSTSEMHFKMTIYLPMGLLGIGIIVFNSIFKGDKAVCIHNKT